MDQEEERAAALEIINKGFGSIPKEDFESFGLLAAFSDDEADHFRGILGLVERYVKQSDPERPLCIAVFGPPGSGKSFSVEQIVEVAAKSAGTSMPLTTLNLTQISSTHELSQLLLESVFIDDNVVPVVFFDEFDAPLDGAPLGWLSWFLAPMHDGRFQLRGRMIHFRRAIYVFAGGTASRFGDFGQTDPTLFKNAKGPDFVSRLRGTLDVKGPNESECQSLRRAVILRSALSKRLEALTGNKSKSRALRISRPLAEAFLDAGRFRHGARSIGAIVEMCTARRGKRFYKQLRVDDLPDVHLRQIHVDRGPFDPREIGGGIGLSAGSENDSQKGYEEAWTKVARELWRLGATVVYGGHPEKGGLTHLLGSESAKLASGPLHESGTPAPPRIRWIDLNREGHEDENITAEPVPELVGPERLDLKARVRAASRQDRDLLDWLTKSLHLYRLRRQMDRQSIARVIMAGKMVGYSGRIPGVVEETVLALHSRRPVYIIGGFGGATEAVGQLLGLASEKSPLGQNPGLRDPFGNGGTLEGKIRANGEAALYDLADLFEADRSALPVTYGEAIDFLWEHSIGGPRWVDNGLSRTENEELFNSDDSKKICDLLVRGLKRAMAQRL